MISKLAIARRNFYARCSVVGETLRDSTDPYLAAGKYYERWKTL